MFPKIEKFLNGLNVFIALTVIVFSLLISSALIIGSTGDEYIDGNNGIHALNYYLHGDISFTTYDKVEWVEAKHMKYYGVGFEILPAIVMKITGWTAHEAIIRHLLCAFFGFVFMLFAALTAQKIKDWWLASITIIIMAISPIVFGLSPIDSKDIPMAAGFAITVYALINLYRQLPHYKWQDCILAALGIALSVSVRIGGLMLLFYAIVGCGLCMLLSADLRKKMLHNKGRALYIPTAICAVGVLVGLCAYPNFFYEGPITHVTNALKLVQEFKQKITMLFEGKIIDSLHLPPAYLLKSYLYTIPLFAWAGLLLFAIRFKTIWRTYNKITISFLLFTLLFAPAYIILTEANVYNGWRHTLFIFSSFAIIAAIGYYDSFSILRQKNKQIIYVCTVCLLMAPTAFWMAKNPRYIYTYHNIIAGNTHNRFDTDYYETSCIQGYKWLEENVISKSDTLVRVGTRNKNVCYSQHIRKTPNCETMQYGWRAFARGEYDYLILTPNFIPAHVVKAFYPPKGTVHIEYIDNQPVCAVVKRENRYDIDGINLMIEGKIAEGMELLIKAYQYNHMNFGTWYWLGYGYYNAREYSTALEFFKNYLAFWPSSQLEVKDAVLMSGHSFVELNRNNEAISLLERNKNIFTDINDINLWNRFLGIAYFNSGNRKKALTHLNKLKDVYPDLAQYIN
ncbi:MAG: tetratricopeptide repeat protein [Marinifilaceae bacterium]